ncbi:hypothetical protein [Yersinia intermedia]|uniref:hypothetical protein n=1 Tax=Yersinia intermedia TaxID=631 RepID=UPI0005DDB40C|nr:hypothetical protein [Yersinia intermedia]CNI96153.1 Uncharacterised protein [Yersinia intermedia]
MLSKEPVRIRHDWNVAVVGYCDFCSHSKMTVPHADGGRICASCCDSEFLSSWQNYARSLATEVLSLREQLAERREPVVPPTIKISEVVAAVSLEQNRKWNGRVGYMAGWNACRDAMLFTADKPADISNKVDITCYSCRRFITFQQHAEADGFCPYCGVEIELDGITAEPVQFDPPAAK